MGRAAKLSIQEYSELTGLSCSKLRYYDKIGLLSPEIRGSNRYRYYAPRQVLMAAFVKVLTTVGTPLSIIKIINKNKTPQNVFALLIQQQRNLDKQLHELQTAYSIINIYCGHIFAGLAVSEDVIRIQDHDEVKIILGEIADYTDTEDFYSPFITFCAMAATKNINLHYPVGGYYESIHSFVSKPAQPTRFFSVDPHGNTRQKTGKFLVAHYKGGYGEFGDTPQKVLAYAQANKLTFRGPLYVTYLLDDVSTVVNQYVSRITVRVF
jgi:DNA-binding transcriptional MerR regulator